MSNAIEGNRCRALLYLSVELAFCLSYKNLLTSKSEFQGLPKIICEYLQQFCGKLIWVLQSGIFIASIQCNKVN